MTKIYKIVNRKVIKMNVSSTDIGFRHLIYYLLLCRCILVTFKETVLKVTIFDKSITILSASEIGRFFLFYIYVSQKYPTIL